MERYTINLSKEERESLLAMIKTGKEAAYKLSHARILLAVDDNERSAFLSDVAISELLHVSPKTIQRIRKRCVEEGLDSAIKRKQHSKTRPRKIQGDEEAHLIAIACSQPPEGRKRWTVRLLADKMVELEILESVAVGTVQNALKKTNLSLG
jgi:transposase